MTRGDRQLQSRVGLSRLVGPVRAHEPDRLLGIAKPLDGPESLARVARPAPGLVIPARYHEAPMEGCPPVSCFCPTYGRVHLLEEAIESFLRQDYPGERELIVLNDLDGQELVLDHPLVRIVNVPTKFTTLGEKRNRCVALARHAVLFPWDDDDIYLPHRLSYSVSRLDPERGWFRPAVALVLTDGRLSGPQENLFHSQSCYTRELFERVGRYAHARKSDDLAFEQAVARAHGRSTLTGMPVTESDIYYLYRWSAQTLYHMSWFSETPAEGPQASERTATLVRKALDSGAIPGGRIDLQPRWARDYPREVADYLASRTRTTDDSSPTPNPGIERITIAELERRLRDEAESEARRRGAERVQEENTRFFRFADLDTEITPSLAERRHLLRAAALRGPDARHAWEAVESAAVPLDRLHPRLKDLLPPLYANLRRLDLEGEATESCKRTYVRTLSNNRRLLVNAQDTLAALQEERIDFVTVDAAALLARYHRDWGARVMPDLSIWIAEADLQPTVDLFLRRGWIARDRVTRTSHRPGLTRFRTKAADLTLRWRLLPQLYQPDIDRDVWDATEPLELGPVTTRVLSPTDQLFEILRVRGARPRLPRSRRRSLDGRRDGDLPGGEHRLAALLETDTVQPVGRCGARPPGSTP